jgi:hypothetical protein
MGTFDVLVEGGRSGTRMPQTSMPLVQGPHLCIYLGSYSSLGTDVHKVLLLALDVSPLLLQAPSKPSTPYGKMLAYYLQMEPRLFESAVHDQFTRLKEERDRQKSESGNQSSGELSTSTDLTLSSLSSRIQEVQEKERRATVEDLMYMYAIFHCHLYPHARAT